ncbi:hypothetical protein [Ruegeria meonggei]|uniref:hypothetical protein n=1 Tax=Ruegeria meonggei TaxID=1446476 RepID=UPI0036718562
MVGERYQTALNRDDISQWLVHFTKQGWSGSQLEPADVVLRRIINSRSVQASKADAITRYHPSGAACFYDVPPQNWTELIQTNPSGRQPYGIIVSKAAFWARGGRPAIYTENPLNPMWPQNERFRLITTALDQPNPIDWTHEREWRVPGDLPLDFQSLWWWPCVAQIRDALLLFRDFSQGNVNAAVVINSIYVIELNRTILRSELD